MRFIMCFLLPPLAISLTKPVQLILNILLCVTLVCWPIAIVHAVWLLLQEKQDKRHKELVAAMARR